MSLQDVGYAVRLTMRKPGLSAAMVLTLALGIGGNTAAFSVINSLLLRPLPVERPSELVRIFGEHDGNRFEVSSYPNLVDVGARTHSLAAVAIHQQTSSAYGLGDGTETASIELVTGNYFSMLGVRTPVGRPIDAEDDVEGRARAVAVVSDGWWKTRLGARSGVVGETIHLNGTPFTVIGVAPASFRGSYDALGTDLWVPLMTYDVVRPRGLPITRRSWGWLSATARLAPGVTLDQAGAEVERTVAGLRAEFPRENRSLKLYVVAASALPEAMGPTVRRVLLFALLVAALALAAACANVANVQLATVFGRRREIAIRLAMGATRARIARQWLAESFLTASLAGVVGTVAAMWLVDAAASLVPPVDQSTLAPPQHVDFRLVLFSALLVGMVTMLFGWLPARRAARVEVAGTLKEETMAATAAARRAWVQAALISAQVAVSLALIASSALLTRSLSASRRFDLGFDTSNLVIATPNTANLGWNAGRGRAYYDDTLARVRALPGVESVALAAVVPLGVGDETESISIDGYVAADGGSSVIVPDNIVSPNYFETLGIPIRRGRGFVAADGDVGGRVVAVVNETMARRYWADGNPVGRTIRLDGGAPIEVVGVAADVTQRVPGEEPRPHVYLPFGPIDFAYGLSFHVRTDRPDPTLPAALRRELRSLDPRVQVPVAMPYEELRQQALAPSRALARVSGGFGLMALLLAIVGIYGVTAHAIASRNRELAVRLALGARPGALVAGVLRQGLRWSIAGIVAGLVLSMMMARLLEAFLFDVSTADTLSLAGGAAVLVVASVLAAYAPARRVVRIDPAATLRG